MSTDYHIYWNFGRQHLKIEIFWGKKEHLCALQSHLKNMCINIDVAMLIVLQLGSDGQIILKWIIKK